MATDLANLLSRRSSILAELAALTASQPDYTKANQSVQWAALRRQLTDELKALNAMIAAFDGPWEVEVQGRG
jgi:hypothetical protein